MVWLVSRPLYKVIVPCALVAPWCRFPVARALIHCMSVSGGNALPCTFIESVSERLFSTGRMVMVADGLRSGTRDEAATKSRQNRMVQGISSQNGFCFGEI